MREESGFTLIEVMVAAALLLVGLIGTLAMLDHAHTTTWSTKAREGATNLQRELIEAARSIPYEQLTPNTIVASIQQEVGLGDADLSHGGWTIRRRGFSYAVAAGECAVDDPRDGYGSHDVGVFCANGAGATTAAQCQDFVRNGVTSATPASGDCGIDVTGDGTVDGLVDMAGTTCTSTCGGTQLDPNPNDYKRIVSLVRWERGQGSRYVLSDTTIANPGLSAAPAVTSLQTPATIPVTDATTLAFTATTTGAATTLGWYVDGTQKGSANGGGGSWSFDWPLGSVSTGSQPQDGEVLDGSYLLSAKAFDQYGQFGASRSVTIVLNRRAAYPPRQLAGGRNGSAVEFEWSPNKEGDLEGYRVYRQPATGEPVLVCTLTSRTTCQDTSPPPDPSIAYFAVGVDKDPQGVIREGQSSAAVTVGNTNSPPNAPPSVSASTLDGNTVLSWTAPTTPDPDSGDAIDHYAIYRDGTAFADRYDRTVDGGQLTYTDTHTHGQTHSYWVAAVDTQLAESSRTGPVTQ
jgi:prepilin-type N-terminal cleavage/methylation domain-containing protein